MNLLKLVSSLLAIFIIIPAAESRCTNLRGRLSCLDFNCSLSWRTVPNSDHESHVIFSLYYAKSYTAHDIVQRWEAVQGCVNVTSRQCSVRALFKDERDFQGYKRFRIDYVTNGTENCQGRRFQQDPLRSVVLSAPPITHIKLGAEELSFRLIYPTDHHEPGLDVQLLRQFVNHKYQVDVREYETNSTVRSYQIKNDLAGIQRIYDLLPATRYVIRVKSAVYPPVVWGPETVIQVVRTLEKPPSIGPHDLKLVGSNFSCTSPDLRDVIIQWKDVEEEYWNGDLLFYEVQAILWETREIETNVIVNISSTMVSLKGLSRWKDYEVVVFANNSAGGTRNNIPLWLRRQIVDERGSQPTEVSITSDQSYTTVHWQPPKGYSECIIGYTVTWTDGRGNEYHVTKWENTRVDVEGHVSKVVVTPLLRKGYERNQSGVASLVYINETASGFNLWFLLLIGVLVLFLVIIVILIAKWKYIKLRWLKPKCKSLNLEQNKVLKPAFDRQVSYEPCLRREKEIFDAPSPGIPSPDDLPPWSPSFGPSSGYENDLPLMTALLQQGLTVVDDIDEIDLAQATLDSMLEGKSRDVLRHRGSESSSKADSAIDTLSYSDVDDGDNVRPMSPPDHGYIAHSSLDEHLRANAPIDDYTVTGITGYVPCTSSSDLPTEIVQNLSENPDNDYIDHYTVTGMRENTANHPTQTSPVSMKDTIMDTNPTLDNTPRGRAAGGTTKVLHQPGFPGNAKRFESPYIPHSEVMVSTSSSCSSRCGEDIADYSQQTIATNITKANAEHQDDLVFEKHGTDEKTPSTDGAKQTQNVEAMKVKQREQASVKLSYPCS